MLKKRLAGVLTASIIAGTTAAPALAASVADLVQQGMYGKAYKQGMAELERNEGDPAFDYAFGVAALETGNHIDAIFALDRVVAVDPGNVDARIALGRALLAVKDEREATIHLQAAQRARPTPAQREALDGYLAQATQIREGRERELSVWVEAFGGYDSNVNSGTHESSLIAPTVFGGVPFVVVLGDDVKQQSAWFHHLKLGASYFHKLDETRSVDVIAETGKKQNLGEDTFDHLQHKVNVGYSVTYQGDLYRIVGRYEQDDVDDDRLRYLWGALGEYTTTGKQSWNAGWEQTFVSGLAKIEYPTQRLRDVNQLLLGTRASKVMGDYRHRVSGYYAFEDHDTQGGKHNGRQLFTVDWTAEYLQLTNWTTWVKQYWPGLQQYVLPQLDKIVPYASVGYSYVTHNDDLEAADETRIDHIFDLELGASWRWREDFLFTAEYRARSARSNISLYDHNRSLFQVGVKYNFM